MCADCSLLKHCSHEVVLTEDRDAPVCEALLLDVGCLSAAQCHLEDHLVNLAAPRESMGREVNAMV